MQPESTQPEGLKFWHCDFCHRGLTARDIHDITDHKVRCYTCAALGAPDVAKPEGTTSPAEKVAEMGKFFADLARANAKPEETPAPEPKPATPDDDDQGDQGGKWPYDHKRQLDECYRHAFMLYGMLVGHGSLPMPILQSQDDCNEAQLAIDAIMEGLALLAGIPFKSE